MEKIENFSLKVRGEFPNGQIGLSVITRTKDTEIAAKMNKANNKIKAGVFDMAVIL